MWSAFPTSDYYGGSVPIPSRQLTIRLPIRRWGPAETRATGEGSHVHYVPVDRIGAQLCPAAWPRLRRRPSAWPPGRPTFPGIGVASLLSSGWRALLPGPYPPDLSRFHAYGASVADSLVVTPLCLARPDPSGGTGPSRRCQGCLPPSPRPLGSGCPQLQRAATTTRRWVLPPHPDTKRLVAHSEVVKAERFTH